MQQTNGSDNQFSPSISIVAYGDPDPNLLESFSKQTYNPLKVFSTQDTETFLSGFQEAIATSDIVTFAKGGTLWANNRLERLVEGFRMNPSSIGVVYTDWTNVFNQSYSARRLTQNPEFIKGDFAVAAFALRDKQVNKPEAIDDKFFLSLMMALIQTHIFIHIPEKLGTWK